MPTAVRLMHDPDLAWPHGFVLACEGEIETIEERDIPDVALAFGWRGNPYDPDAIALASAWMLANVGAECLDLADEYF